MKCFQMVGTRETFLGKMKIFGKTFPGRNYPNLRGETEETFYWQVSMAGNNWGGGERKWPLSEQFFPEGFIPWLQALRLKNSFNATAWVLSRDFLWQHFQPIKINLSRRDELENRNSDLITSIHRKTNYGCFHSQTSGLDGLAHFIPQNGPFRWSFPHI